MTVLGPLCAFGAAITWAYATARYARASRDVGSIRINQARALIAFPAFACVAFWIHGLSIFSGMTFRTVAWLIASIIGSYVLGDSVFLTAARRAGVTTALSIASTYPLWAALFGTLVAGEPFGLGRSAGTLLCVFGVVWLVRLSGARDTEERRTAQSSGGVVLAVIASLLWAANSICVKEGATGFDPAQVNALRYSVAFVLLTAQTWLPSQRPLPRSPSGGWGPVIPAFIADALLGSSLYVYGLSHSDLAVGATLSALAPLISVPVAIVVGEESWSASRLAAVVATVGGVVLLVATGR